MTSGTAEVGEWLRGTPGRWPPRPCNSLAAVHEEHDSKPAAGPVDSPSRRSSRPLNLVITCRAAAFAASSSSKEGADAGVLAGSGRMASPSRAVTSGGHVGEGTDSIKPPRVEVTTEEEASSAVPEGGLRPGAAGAAKALPPNNDVSGEGVPCAVVLDRGRPRAVSLTGLDRQHLRRRGRCATGGAARLTSVRPRALGVHRQLRPGHREQEAGGRPPQDRVDQRCRGGSPVLLRCRRRRRADQRCSPLARKRCGASPAAALPVRTRYKNSSPARPVTAISPAARLECSRKSDRCSPTAQRR